APSLGGSPAPVERGKGRPGARPRLGETVMPEEGAGRVSPSPAEAAKPGGRPVITARPAGPREGVSPLPQEGGRGRGPAGERPPRPGGAGGPAGVGRATPPSAFQSAPQPEHGRQPVRRPGEEQGQRQSEPPQNSPQGQPEPMRFGTPAPRAPMGAAERGQPRGGPPAGLHQQVAPPAGGGQADEARAQRDRMQGARGQPPPPQQYHQPPQQQQRGGAPA